MHKIKTFKYKNQNVILKSNVLQTEMLEAYFFFYLTKFHLLKISILVITEKISE